MYVRDLVVGLVRRWYLVLAGMLITAGMAYGTLSLVQPTYHSDASVLLLPPRTSLGKNGNQFLYLGGLNQALGILSTRMNSADAQAQIEREFPGATLEIAPDTTTTGPILSLSSTAASPQEAQQLMRTGLASADPALAALQDELRVPASSRISLMVLTADSSPTRDTKNQLRAAVAVSALGLGGTLLLTALIDGWLMGGRRPRVLDPAWWRRDARPGAGDDWDWWAEEQARARSAAPVPDDPGELADADVKRREKAVVGDSWD